MIQIRTLKSADGIIRLRINGHANSQEVGKDLVCAAVSGIVTGAMNALDEILPQTCELSCGEGFAEIIVLENSKDLQTVLKTVLWQLLTVEQEYPKYVKLIEELQEVKL